MEEGTVARGRQAFALEQNGPNPFNASTVIRYFLPLPMDMALKVYNSLGQEVTTLIEGYQEGGWHRVVWDGRDDQGYPVSSGIYAYRLGGEEITATRTMTLVR